MAINTITIELSAEDRARLDRIADLLAGIKAPVAATQPPVQPDPVPTAADPAEDITTTPAPAVSLAEFQKAITQKFVQSPSAKAAVKALVNRYAESVGAVPEDKRAEILAELAKL